MSKTKDFEQKVVKVDGIEYTLQKPLIEERIKLRSKIINGGELSQYIAYKEYLDKIVVLPKLKFSDFEENMTSLDKLMTEAENFVFSDIKKGK